MGFRDRRDAGRQLAQRLLALREQAPVVVGLPRGGVPVAFEVAQALAAPLDVLIVRKLGVPFQPELGMGAVGEGGVRVLNPNVIRAARVSEADITKEEQLEGAAVRARADLFRRGRPPVQLAGRTVVIVDDGLATGGTARAAIKIARAQGAKRVVLAVPVAPLATVTALKADADDIVCLESPDRFSAIGAWYDDFSPTPDSEVIALLDQATRARPETADLGGVDEDVLVGPWGLPGRLTIPSQAAGLVAFAHGSGSGRLSPRNQMVARVLQRRGLGTLLFDLLSPEEAAVRANVFDIPLLAERLATGTTSVRRRAELQGLPLGYFGASTGAGAALWAAAEPESPARAIVSRGGRPDLAGPRLGAVKAPTLLIVGGRDQSVLELNWEASRHLRCEHDLQIVPGATHLFEEPGTLDLAARLAADWFTRHLTR